MAILSAMRSGVVSLQWTDRQLPVEVEVLPSTCLTMAYDIEDEILLWAAIPKYEYGNHVLY